MASVAAEAVSSEAVAAEAVLSEAVLSEAVLEAMNKCRHPSTSLDRTMMQTIRRKIGGEISWMTEY